MKQHTLLLLLMLLIVSSCGSTKKMSQNTSLKQSIKDSIVTRVVPRDTIVYTPADTTQLSVMISELTETALQKHSDRVSASIRRVGNRIDVQCIADELKQVIALQEKTIAHYRELAQYQEDIIEITRTKKSPILMYICIVAVILFVLGLLFNRK